MGVTRAKGQPAFIFMEKALDMSVSSQNSPRTEVRPPHRGASKAELSSSQKKVQGEERGSLGRVERWEPRSDHAQPNLASLLPHPGPGGVSGSFFVLNV